MEGEDVRDWTRKRYAQSVADAAKPRRGGFTVREMVLMGRTPTLGGFTAPSRDDERIACAVIDELGLGALVADRDSTTLRAASGRWCRRGRLRSSRACW